MKYVPGTDMVHTFTELFGMREERESAKGHLNETA